MAAAGAGVTGKAALGHRGAVHFINNRVIGRKLVQCEGQKSSKVGVWGSFCLFSCWGSELDLSKGRS